MAGHSAPPYLIPLRFGCRDPGPRDRDARFGSPLLTGGSAAGTLCLLSMLDEPIPRVNDRACLDAWGGQG